MTKDIIKDGENPRKKNVENANIEKDYDKTIRLLDEDIADRTPAEQHKALKISGLMNLLVASKKLKTAISTIANYDLPEDQLLLQLSKSLESWIQKNYLYLLQEKFHLS